MRKRIACLLLAAIAAVLLAACSSEDDAQSPAAQNAPEETASPVPVDVPVLTGPVVKLV